LLRRVNVFVTVALDDLHKQLSPYYSDIGRPSVDPELMIRMPSTCSILVMSSAIGRLLEIIARSAQAKR
jgi:hypothetical protein